MKSLLRQLVQGLSPSLWAKLTRRRQRWIEYRHWQARIADVVACPDNARLRRVPGAGRVVNQCQIMHNGLKVRADGYYGHGLTCLLRRNRGCHEPQEEVVFDAIVTTLPRAAVMIECGAYWGFYSLWFLSVVPGSRAFLIEPVEENLRIGRENLRLNGVHGHFTQACVGRAPGPGVGNGPCVAMDSFAQEHGLARIDLLHADIQGAELELLEGADGLLCSGRIDYLFLSTHSVELHAACRQRLAAHGYVEFVSVDVPESYSVDGILVFHRPQIHPPPLVHPSRKPAG